MAIKKENTTFTVDFGYEHDKTKEFFKIKLHQTETFGQTISVCGEVGSFESGSDVFMALPMHLFVEVVDFLRQNRYIGQETPQRSETLSKTTPKSNRQVESSAKKTVVSGLPIPDIDGKTGHIAAQKEPIEIREEEEKEENDSDSTQNYTRPIQNLLAPYNEDLEETMGENEEKSENEVIEINEEDEEDEEDEESDSETDTPNAEERKKEDIERMAKERSEAAKKAEDGKNKIKKIEKRSVLDRKSKKSKSNDDDDDDDDYQKDVEEE